MKSINNLSLVKTTYEQTFLNEKHKQTFLSENYEQTFLNEEHKQSNKQSNTHEKSFSIENYNRIIIMII
jgi:hypothetical protein